MRPRRGGLPDNALINTQSGFIRACDVREGTHVLSEDGSVTTVDHVKSYTGTGIVEIKITGTIPLRMDPDKAVLTFCDGVYNWKPAQELYKGDYVLLDKKLRATPIIYPAEKVTQGFVYLLGWYAARGRALNVCSINVAGKSEKDIANLMAACKATTFNVVHNDMAETIYFGGTMLADKFNYWFGADPSGKRIPDFIYGASDPGVVKEFLAGYLDAIGHEVADGKSKGTLIVMPPNEAMAFQLQSLAAQFSVFMSLCVVHRHKNSVRYTMNLPASEAHVIMGGPQRTSRSRRNAIAMGYHILLPVKEVVVTPYTGRLWDIRTSSGSLLVQNIIVDG